MRRGRQWRAWSFFKKGAAYPRMGVVEVNKRTAGQSHTGCASCGFAHFSFLKEGWQGQNKTKTPHKAFVWQNSHWVFFFYLIKSVSTDEMIFKHPERTGTKQFCPQTPGTPAQPFLRVTRISPHREQRTPPTISLPVWWQRGLFFPSYDEIYIHAAEASIWGLFGQNPKCKERIDFNLF